MEQNKQGTACLHNAKGINIHGTGRLVRMSEIVEREVEWLWKPYIPLKKITLFRGDPGIGKTFLALMVTAIVSNGHGFPNKSSESGFTPATQGNVLFLTAEDDLADTVKPRLRKANADMERVFSYTDYITFSDPKFEEIIKEVLPALVIVDPLQAFLGADIDMNRPNEIRPIFSKIRQMAENYNFTLIILEHLNKNLGGKAIYRGLGSMDIPGAARSILTFGCDPKNENIKGFMHTKSNLEKKGDIIGFSISENGAIEWNLNTALTADMILGNSNLKIGRPSFEIDEAVEFLKTELKGTSKLATDMYTKAEELGISKKTLERAKKEVKVDSFQKDRKWYWLIE